MPTALILHSSIDGHTIRICQHLHTQLARQGVDCTLQPLEACEADSLLAADLIVIGASIRYGHHRPAVLNFIRKQRTALAAKTTAIFSVNLVARKPAKTSAETNPYLRKLLAHAGWQPSLAASFAGRLDYPRCTTLDRLMIRLIMWLTGGPTDPSGVFEFTDWAQVEAFGLQCSNLLVRPPE